MNRCSLPWPAPLRGRGLAACLLATVLPLAVAAQEVMPIRQFPPTAQRGMLTVVAPPEVTVNGTVERLSPGVRIRGPNNTLVMSGALVGRTVAVNYLRERGSGMLQEIWILNAAELETQRSGWDVIRNFRFGADEHAPKRDDGNTPFDQLPRYPQQ